jgi:beta-lactamase superfamily II metal-dependent hydrolase
MDFVIDFLYVGDGDAIIIWARDQGNADWVFFVDGGNLGNGEKIISHYTTWIKPYLQTKRAVGFINSHPHEDHIDGLLEVLEKLTGEISFGIYNDPVECITAEHRDRIHREYLDGTDPDITHLYKTFEQIERLNNYCEKNKVRRYNAYVEDVNFFGGAFKLLSPTRDFYVNMVQHFTDVDFLKRVDFSKKAPAAIDIYREELLPCDIVDEINDATPENLTSTVIQMTDSAGKKYILTADAGTDSFDYLATNGFDNSNVELVQLPHHGSRRNISSAWIKKFNAKNFFVSAEGNVKHPRKAVINCIKRNLADSKVYGTHTHKVCLSYTTGDGIFPLRGWITAVPL